MSHLPDRAWLLIRGVAVTAALFLLAPYPVESSMQRIDLSPEPDKVLSCTMADVSEEQHVVRDPAIPAPDGPRVAAGEPALDGERVSHPDPAPPQVCPLHHDTEPGPPQGRP
jgi:hypothetical protein